MQSFARTDCALLHLASIVSLLIVSLIVPSTYTFNLDTANYIKHEGETGSMFGFSVALHKDSGRSWVIVGAPRTDLSNIIHQRVFRGGAVYRCDIYDDNRCHLIPFDSAGNQHNDRGEQIDTKSDQWFGATVSSAGENGPLVACAPRYVFHTMQPRKVMRVEPVGTCYMSKKNFQEFTEYSPCRTMFWGYHKQGSCQAGMSAAISKDGERLFIGAPGSWYWQGQAYSINTDAIYPFKPPRYSAFGEGQTYSFSLNNPKDKVWATRESTAVEDDSYLGYSSVAGTFYDTPGVAVGMPRGGGLLGKVCIFSWNMTNFKNITGEQIGAYFGYSLAVGDIDGDKLDDLIIGAPMHTEPNNEGKYEMGQVFIFSQKFKFEEAYVLNGINSRGRFGLSLTSLGDMNLDGYGDFAVGAPYDGPNGKGAVYIFYGAENGPLSKASQIIYAEDVAGNNYLNTFGFSVSGGIDLDGNMYPDMVVGAYDSNTAFVFKSRPVARVEATTTFDVNSKLVNLDDKTCTTVRDRKKVTCATVNSCLRYNGVNLPPQIDIDVSWVLDAKKTRSPRLFFLNEEGKNIRNSTMRLNRGKTECRTERVYIADNIRDKLTPLEVEMRFNMRENYYQNSQQQRTRRSLEPVIDQNLGVVQRDSINIQKNCGPDNVCIPDLRLEVQSNDTHLLGSDDLLEFDVKIKNLGEDAFESNFFMSVPQGMTFRKIVPIGEKTETPVTCTAPSPATNNTLKCDIGNPLLSNKNINFRVILLPASRQGLSSEYDFFMGVNSTNPESGTEFDNNYKKTVGISVATNLTVKGVSLDEEILYNTTDFVAFGNATQEEQIGPQVVHIYEIFNSGGPSTIEEAEIFFLWPFETKTTHEPLLYLLNQPESTKNVRCEYTPYANTKGLELNRTLITKSFLVSQGAIEQSSLNTESSYHSTGYSSGGKQYTAEEEREFEEESFRESAGDASDVHAARANQAAQAQSGGQYRQYASNSYSSPGSITYSTRLNQSRYSPEKYDDLNSQQRYQASGSNVYRAGAFGAGGSGTRKLDDFSAEGSVSQDISGGRARGQVKTSQSSQSSQSVHSSQSAQSAQSAQNAQSATGSTGRRRMQSQQDGEAFRPGLITGATQYENKDEFNVGTLELNTLPRDNVDEEIRRHGNAAHLAAASEKQNAGSSGYSGHSGYSATSSGSPYQQSSSSSSSSFSQGGGQSGFRSSSNNFQADGKHTSISAGNNNMIGIDEPADDFDEQDDDEYYDTADDEQNVQNQHQQQHLQNQQQKSVSKQQQIQQQHYNSFSSSNGANQGFKHYSRIRRDADDTTEEELESKLKCSRTECAYVRCVVSNLEKDSSAWIALRMRLVTQTLNSIAPNTPLNISTMVLSRITKLPYIGTPHKRSLETKEVKIVAVPIPEPKPDIVPLWIIILSAIVGVIILLLLIYLLYMCGFFKRNRPEHSQERQPLNRNNGYHGDERL